MAKTRAGKTTKRPKTGTGAAKRHETAFKQGLVARGEAAVPDQSGRLPPGATHEITGDAPDGLPKVKRRRFSAF